MSASVSTGPKMIFVGNPQDTIEDKMKELRKKPQQQKQLQDFDIFDDLQKIEIKTNFIKYMDKNLYSKQNSSMYTLESEESLKKYKRIEDGYGEISFLTYTIEGELLSDSILRHRIKIHLFNQDDDHYMGFHMAILCMEEEEESWFFINDAYTSPLYMAEGLTQLDSKIEMQASNKIYKIKLHKVKEQLKKQEAVIIEDGQSITYDTDQEEIKLIKEIQNVEERRSLCKKFFYDKQYSMAFEKYLKLGMSIQNLENRFTKYLSKENALIQELRELYILIAQNTCVSAYKAELWVKLEDVAKSLLSIDPNNIKGNYYLIRYLINQSYFEESLEQIQIFAQKFPDAAENQEFQKYIVQIEKKISLRKNNEKKVYQKMFDANEVEEKREKIKKITHEQIEGEIKREKESFVQRILDPKGFEFSEADLQFIEKLDPEDSLASQTNSNNNNNAPNNNNNGADED